MSEWKSRIDDAERVRRTWEPWWDANVAEYAPKASENPESWATSRVRTNRHFALVEQKKAQLFFRSPEVVCTPSPLMTAQADVVETHEQLVNAYLGVGRLGGSARRMVQEVLHDAVMATGIGVTKIGFSTDKVPVKTWKPVLDPMTQQPAVGMDGAPIREEITVEIPIFESWDWTRISPKSVLIPADFKSTTFDDAPWLGFRWREPRRVVARRFGLDPEAVPVASTTQETTTLTQDPEKAQSQEVASGVEIWYKAHIYRDDVRNPEVYYRLVFVDGIDEPVADAMSPYQTLDEQTGRLTPDSMRGNPIHILTLRTMPDSAYPPADTTISMGQQKELDRFREQQMRQRDANIPLRGYNSGLIPADLAEKLSKGQIGDWVAMPEDAMNPNAQAFMTVGLATYPRENMVFEDKLDNDMARAWALDANQGGTRTETARTATELQLIQTATNVRLDAERTEVLDWYIAGVVKFGTLIQRFMTGQKAAEIVGPEKAQAWSQTMPQIPLPVAFTARPDSTQRPDGAADKKAAIDAYQFLRKDPAINPQGLLKAVMNAYNLDPGMLVTKPPQEKPPQPSVSLSIKGEDFVGPQAPIIIELLAQSGVQLSPGAVNAVHQAAALMPPPPTGPGRPAQHGGLADRVPPMSKHTADMSGGQVGNGNPETGAM
jgi:hypothetical protein